MPVVDPEMTRAAGVAQLPPASADRLGPAPSAQVAASPLRTPGGQVGDWATPPPVTLADGSRLQLYKDGQALQAAYEAIRHARHRIGLEAYIFADDDTGNAFADLLAEKARSGVATHVIYDSFGSCGFEQLWRRKRALFGRMRQAGVRLREFNPIRWWECRFTWRPFNRDHRKLLVVDHDIAGLGGLNVGREYAGSWVVKTRGRAGDAWRDNAVGVIGPAARPLHRAFARTWFYCTHGGPMKRAEMMHHVDDGEMGVLASVPTVGSRLPRFLVRVLGDARQSIFLTMAYFVPDEDLVQLLVDAARRGVRVRLMLPSKSDVTILILAARSFYERLMTAGVEVYERQAVILHAKTMVVDGRLTVIGSMNLDHRSIEYNCEISAIIRSEEFGRQMQALFEHDVERARQINPVEWRERPIVDRFGQWAVSRARYLM